MIKVVNPLFRKEESADSAYMNCACICYNSNAVSDTKSGSWAPFSGGCHYSCNTKIKDNSAANQSTSSGK